MKNLIVRLNFVQQKCVKWMSSSSQTLSIDCPFDFPAYRKVRMCCYFQEVQGKFASGEYILVALNPCDYWKIYVDWLVQYRAAAFLYGYSLCSQILRF